MPTVLITGAGRGLGHELARQYAADGWKVIGTERGANAEHRLDASLIDFVPVSWAIAGFRIVSK